MSSPFSSREGSSWPVTAWLMLLLTMVAGTVGVAGGVLSPVIVLDVVSLWPLALPVAVALGWLAVRRRRASPRSRALPPLFLLTWLLLAAGLHLGGWIPLPSSSVDHLGPKSLEASAVDLAVRLEVGSLRIQQGGDSLYEVRVLRNGGRASAPQVVETTADGRIRVVVIEQPPDDWFRFGGWEVLLAEEVEWSLVLDGSDVEADLEGLAVGSVELRGRGHVQLGAVTGTSTARVTGSYDVEVPADVPVRVVGTASVPDGWRVDDEGSSSIATGEGWTLEVANEATVAIATR